MAEQSYEGQDQSDAQPDEYLHQMLQSTLEEAEKSLAYHRGECDRQEIIRSACMAALEQFPGNQPQAVLHQKDLASQTVRYPDRPGTTYS